MAPGRFAMSPSTSAIGARNQGEEAAMDRLDLHERPTVESDGAEVKASKSWAQERTSSRGVPRSLRLHDRNRAADRGDVREGRAVMLGDGTHPEGGAYRRIKPWRILPVLLTVDEAADLLRSSRRAIYAMVERRQLPGVVRIRRRVLLSADDLLRWLNQKRASSPEE